MWVDPAKDRSALVFWFSESIGCWLVNVILLHSAREESEMSWVFFRIFWCFAKNRVKRNQNNLFIFAPVDRSTKYGGAISLQSAIYLAFSSLPKYISAKIHSVKTYNFTSFHNRNKANDFFPAPETLCVCAFNFRFHDCVNSLLIAYWCLMAFVCALRPQWH